MKNVVVNLQFHLTTILTIEKKNKQQSILITHFEESKQLTFIKIPPP